VEELGGAYLRVREQERILTVVTKGGKWCLLGKGGGVNPFIELDGESVDGGRCMVI